MSEPLFRVELRGNNHSPDPTYLEEFQSLDGADQQKHVFACFGLAGYCAQCIEADVKILLLLYFLLTEKPLTMAEVDKMDNAAQRKTLGQLFHDIRGTVEFDERASDLLADALSQRNFLIHEFYWNHAEDFMSRSGMERMVEDLSQMILSFDCVRLLLHPVNEALIKMVGIPPELIQGEYERMVKAANGMNYRDS